MKSWIQLAQQQSKVFELAIPLIIGETYTISMNSNELFIISVGDVFVGETVDGSLEFIAANSGDVMITSYGDISMEFEIKLELGSQTEWSPAPEDGYDYQGDDGAWHIETSGGTSPVKYRYRGQVRQGTFTMGLNVKNFSDKPMRVYSVPLGQTLVQPLEHKIDSVTFENTVQRVDYQFNPVSVADPLDFIGYRPSIVEGSYPFNWDAKYTSKLRMIYPFVGGEKIVIDLDKQHITINGNNAMKYLRLDSDFFEIPKGNDVAVYIKNGTGDVKLKARYL